MARPFKHKISILINEGREAEARAALQKAIVAGGGTFAGAARVLDASYMAVMRWVSVLGVSSSYDGRAGYRAMQEKRETQRRLTELAREATQK